MENKTQKPRLGFIGQGFVGKSYADSFVDRGYPVVRYSLEPEHVGNKEKIQNTDIVVIAVPTPTVHGAFDDSHVRGALLLLREGQIVVIKSTVQKGTTMKLQKENPHLTILHVPEFLRESYARFDVDNPTRTIIGMGEDSERQRKAAQLIEKIFPRAPHTMVVSATDAEFIKYTHNTMGVMMIVYANILYDLAVAHGVAWDSVKEAILHNPWFPEKYLDPIHKTGRGAGGHCFIKDFAALVESYEKNVPHDVRGRELLRAIEEKNKELLISSHKDIEILRETYGDTVA